MVQSTGISNSSRGNNNRSILEEVEAERMAKADRGENPWGESYAIFDEDRRHHY
jgi:hypothetical protein